MLNVMQKPDKYLSIFNPAYYAFEIINTFLKRPACFSKSIIK